MVERHRLLPVGSPAPLAVVGATASGKSALALNLARRRGDVELVSVDSMQVYRGMDIGTAKPTMAEQAEIHHHVIDLVDPWETFEVHSFQEAVARALADIARRGRRAVLVGGTGLYLQAVVDGFEIPGRYAEVLADLAADPDTVGLHARLREMDPVAAARVEPGNRRPFSSYGPGVGSYPPTPIRMVGIRLPQAVVVDRIEGRYREQVAAGFLTEIERLAAGPPLSRTAAQALGYRELLAYVAARDAGDPAPDFDEALDEAVRRTRAFARRQRAWFRRDPRITWLDAEVDPQSQLDALEAIAAVHWGQPS
jgi:tRNA dimethylallyltransferase